MKKALLLFAFVVLGIILVNGQVVIFHEDFELPSLDDSVTNFSTPTAGYAFAVNTRLHYGANSLRSDTCQVKANTVVYLTSNTFSTIGNTYVLITFSQICKIDFLDMATLEASNDGGVTWTQLTGPMYLGTGQYVGNGNRFACNSYANLWQPSYPQALPAMSWWKSETFDISTICGNTANAKVRFKLGDGGQVGPNNNKGWYLDNIKVTMAPSELIPPNIILAPQNPTGVVWATGPFNIKAKISDVSGIDTAYVVYTVNNGPNDTVGMIPLLQDTMKAVLPAINDSDQVCYYVVAYDNSLAHNYARNPVSSCVQFTGYEGLTFPFFDNFDVNIALWTPSQLSASTTCAWQLGTPSYGLTNSVHSPPNSWDVNLDAPYGTSGNCALTSPVFDFSNAVDARLSFWINYNIDTWSDGVRLEYTTNGTIWNTLGSVGDPLSENWYTIYDWNLNSPLWNGNSNGWIKCKYKLSLLNNVVGEIRFRFVFLSDAWTQFDGFSLDDFSITLPAPQEVAINSIITPNTGCGLQNEIVSIDLINTGLSPITTGLTASFQKKPGAPIVTENVNINVPVNDTVTYTFTAPLNLLVGQSDSTYFLKAWVNLVTDPNHGDDTTFKMITSMFLALAPTVISTTINYGTFTTINAVSLFPVTWYDAPANGNILGTGPSYTTPILYGTTIYYPAGNGPNGCPGHRAQDTVYVGQAPPFDGSALIILSPITGFNLTNNETVKTRIRNYGTQAISNFTLSYSIDNGPAVTDTITSTLNPGDTITYTFPTPANLLPFATYNFKSWITVGGDINQVNDTAYAVIINKMYVYCDSYATSAFDDDIGNVTISNLNNGNPLPSMPNPTSVNVYTDFTYLPPIYLAKGLSYPVSVSQINSGSFYTCYCKIFVDWNYDGIFDENTETAFTAGPTTSAAMTMTGTLDVPVNAHVGLTRFRVVLMETWDATQVHACGTYSYGETEDYVAYVAPQIPHDAGIQSLITPPQVYPQGFISPVEVVAKNYGSDPITSMIVSYQFDNDPPVNQTWSGNLLPNTSVNIIFPTDTLAAGVHDVCAYTTLAGDSNTFNDTLCRTITGVPVDTLPYYDNFDGVVKFYPSVSTGTNWIHGAPQPTIWPNAAFSAPNVWAINLNMNGYDFSANCTLTTQIFDFTNAINAKISFWYNSSVEQWGDGVQLQYSTDGGNTWTLLGTQNDPLGINWYNYSNWSYGPVWTGSSNNWLKATYLLSDFNLLPTFRFRFLFLSDTWQNGPGFAIDDFKITIPYPQDAGVDSILLPQGQGVAFTQLVPTVRLNNFGSDTLHTIDLSYTINGGAPINGTWTGTLNPGDFVNYQFTNTYLVPQGNYQLKVYTNQPNDGDHINDTTSITLFGIPTFMIPYYDDFDSTLTYWYTTGTQWEHGTPTANYINTSLSQPFCWKTNLDGVYVRTGLYEHLYSPMFDFTLTGYDSLIFDHWVHIFQNDGGRVEYLSTTGWKIVGWMGDPNAVNWYTNNITGWSNDGGIAGWHKSAYDLSVIPDFATPTQFRFSFICIYPNTTFDGWAIDNFELSSPRIPKDAGVIAINQPGDSTTYGTDLIVNVTIKNFGSDTLYSIPTKYQINGTTVNVGNWTGTLLSDSTTTFTFNPHPSPLYNYNLCAFTDLPLDVHFHNDTTCMLITAVAPPYDLTVRRIVSPVYQTIHGDSATVKIVVKNIGLNPITDIPLGYCIADTMIIVHENLIPPSPLNPGDSLTYTFNQRYSYKFLGFYGICAFASHINDGYKPNDTLCKIVEELFTMIPETESNPLYLSQNIPNPADESTQIVLRLPKSGQVRIDFVNLLGQKVMGIDEKMSEGEHLLTWNTRSLKPGIYYYTLYFDQRQMMKKMLITHD